MDPLVSIPEMSLQTIEGNQMNILFVLGTFTLVLVLFHTLLKLQRHLAEMSHLSEKQVCLRLDTVIAILCRVSKKIDFPSDPKFRNLHNTVAFAAEDRKSAVL